MMIKPSSLDIRLIKVWVKMSAVVVITTKGRHTSNYQGAHNNIN